jgi:hypothetical protein
VTVVGFESTTGWGAGQISSPLPKGGSAALVDGDRDPANPINRKTTPNFTITFNMVNLLV